MLPARRRSNSIRNTALAKRRLSSSTSAKSSISKRGKGRRSFFYNPLPDHRYWQWQVDAVSTSYHAVAVYFPASAVDRTTTAPEHDGSRRPSLLAHRPGGGVTTARSWSSSTSYLHADIAPYDKRMRGGRLASDFSGRSAPLAAMRGRQHARRFQPVR